MLITGLIFQQTKGKLQQELNTYARQEFINKGKSVQTAAYIQNIILITLKCSFWDIKST